MVHMCQVHSLRWYYDILTGRVEQYDEGKPGFVPLAGWTDNKLVDKLDQIERSEVSCD